VLVLALWPAATRVLLLPCIVVVFFACMVALLESFLGRIGQLFIPQEIFLKKA
jgi:hypothetical protein